MNTSQKIRKLPVLFVPYRYTLVLLHRTLTSSSELRSVMYMPYIFLPVITGGLVSGVVVAFSSGPADGVFTGKR